MQKGYLYFVARTYLQIFILQGIIISIVLLPFTISLSSPKLHISNISFGLVLWIIGFIFESTADKQLDTFIKNRAHHKRTIMTTGLFRYSRHPNYFGESLMWWGIAYIAYIATGSLLVFLSPLLITYLLLFVSGVPMLEKKWKGNKEWEIYKSKTSVFFPLPERE
jgi:steroid 5-alpha reductase family enzyme